MCNRWCCGALAATFVVLCFLVPRLWNLIDEQRGHYDGRLQAHGILYYGLKAVRRGVREEVAGRRFGAAEHDLLAVQAWTLNALLGRTFMNRFAKVADLQARSVMGLKLETAPQSFCRDTLNYLWVLPDAGGFDHPAVLADASDVNAWVAACLDEYPKLREEERALLRPYHKSGQIPQRILMGEQGQSKAEIQASAMRMMHLVPEDDSEPLAPGELRQIFRRSVAHSAWSTIQEDANPMAYEYCSQLNLRKPRRAETWADLGKAVRQGRLTTFDAAQLLPDLRFNMSMQELAEGEGNASSRIPVMMEYCSPLSLHTYTQDRMMYVARNVTNLRGYVVFDLEEQVQNGGMVGALNSDGRDEDVMWRLVRERAGAGLPENHCENGFLNARRVPSFYKGLPNVAELLGIQDDVLRSQSHLWLGASKGSFGYNEEDSVHVQLAGHSFALLVPQNYSDVLFGDERAPSGVLPQPADIERTPRWKSIPFHFLHLAPGSGLVLPSKTYHRFTAQTQDRIAVSWAFIPRWKRMEESPAGWYAQNRRAFPTRFALRQLWARTVARLYDTTGKGIAFAGQKLEFL